VWREADASDHVCVSLERRAEAKADNAAADSRKNALAVRLSQWIPNTTTCDGGVCTSDSDNAPRHLVVVTQSNVGTVELRLVRTNGKITTWTGQAKQSGKMPGGTVDFKTSQLVCPGVPNAYFVVRDRVSGRSSALLNIRVGCATL
jgi:hypothetical protein